MEKRKHPRIKIDNLSIEVMDGAGLLQGLVADISLSGIRINNLPERMDAEAKKITVVFSENKKFFRMDVNPRWHIDADGKTSMGVRILDVPWTWTDFIIRHEMMSIIS